MPSGRTHDVCGFEIAMDDARLVRRVQTGRHLRGDVARLGQRKRPASKTRRQ
jgi:hypothetical protein